MDRKLLIELFQDGMKYSPGKHRLWISKCFEITVLPDQVVELDEYEGFCAQENCSPKGEPQAAVEGRSKRMFHVGRSILHLKDGQVVEKKGIGWKRKSQGPPEEKKA